MSKEKLRASNAPLPVGPYSSFVEVNGFIFCSGQIPINPQTQEVVSEDIKEQARQVMENIKATLLAANLSLKHIVKTTIFLTSMKDMPQVNEIYASYFSESSLPARSCVEVSHLPKDVKIEIEVLASRC